MLQTVECYTKEYPNLSMDGNLLLFRLSLSEGDSSSPAKKGTKIEIVSPHFYQSRLASLFFQFPPSCILVDESRRKTMRIGSFHCLVVSTITLVKANDVLSVTHEQHLGATGTRRRREKSSKSENYLNRHDRDPQTPGPHNPVGWDSPTLSPTIDDSDYTMTPSETPPAGGTSHPTIPQKLKAEKRNKSSKSGRSDKLTLEPKASKKSKKYTLHPTPPPPPSVSPPTPTVSPPTPTINPPSMIPPPSATPAPTSGSTPPPTGEPGCSSPLATALESQSPETFTRNPERCCGYSGPSAVFATHGNRNDAFPSGFEAFWNEFYEELETTASLANVCFVMTGVDQNASTVRTLSEILSSLIGIISQESDVAAFMVTDPDEELTIVESIRTITNSPTLAPAALFNAGYDNVVIEAIITGGNRLPFVGTTSDTDYGTVAARVSSDLLNGQTAIPLCFNARTGELSFIGERCSTFYEELGVSAAPASGIPCHSNSTSDDILQRIISTGANAVFAHVDCCAALGEAAERARDQGRTLVAGCQDLDTSSGGISFIVGASIPLQAYQSASWVFLPVLKSIAGYNGTQQTFPGLRSLIQVDVEETILPI